ncbi:MAG: TetR/AcrR family transcriptional regulator [Firmicutes bacterium]|nr:TetR/AcrR family transcriptional regulator [Bacillota bacterium]
MAQRRDGAKYQAILAAAVRVMAESGYHGAQVARIAREAGVADGTVYLYFKNKEDILLSILRETIGQIVTLSALLDNDLVGPKEALRTLIDAHLKSLGDNRDLAVVLQLHLRQADRHLREQVADMMRPYHRTLDRIIALGKAAGTFRASGDDRILRRMIFGTLDETVSAWIFSGGRYDLRSQAGAVYDALMWGLAGSAGQDNTAGNRQDGEVDS